MSVIVKNPSNVVVGSYSTIQAAIDAGTTLNGYTLELDPGVYNENVTVSKALTIKGANAGIAGTGVRGLESIIQGTTTVTATAGPTIIDGVEVRNVTDNLTSFFGIDVQTSADVTVRNTRFNSPGVNGPDDRAINLSTLATGDVVIENNLFTGGATGKFADASWTRGIWSDGTTTSLAITGNTFKFSRTGINLDGHDNATTTISGNTFETLGSGISIGSGDSTITSIGANTFNDVNTDFNFRNFTTAVTFNATTSGVTLIDDVPNLILGGDGGDTLTGSAADELIHGNNFGSPAGGSATADADLLSGMGGNDILIGRNGDDTLHGGSGADTVHGGNGNDSLTGGTEADTLSGDGFGYIAGVDSGSLSATPDGTGNDTLDGGGGNDSLIGGNGVDSAVGYASGFTPTISGGSWIVSNGSETDTLTGVEKVVTASSNFILVDKLGANVGGFQTIQAAIDAAADGDIILVGPGTFTENLNVNKAVQIRGANFGVAGTGVRGAETTIAGTILVTIAVGQAILDGIEVLNTTDNLTAFNGVDIQTSHDVIVRNSKFTATNAVGSVEDRAIMLSTLATGDVVIEDNLISGASSGKFSTASWHRGIWSDGSTSSLTIDGNTFEFNRTGINLDGFDNATTSITNNIFLVDGTAISIGSGDSTITGISNNTLNDTDTDFNLRNFVSTSPISFNISALGLTFIDDIANVILGGDGSDSITGSSGNDLLHGNNFGSPAGGSTTADADVLSGLGGNDLLIGRSGGDVLDGGADNDSLFGGDGADSLTGGAGADLLSGDGFGYVVGVDSASLAAAPDGTGNDTLLGGVGNDTLIGGLGADSISAGDDNDVINATHADGDDQISGGNGFDILDYSLVNGVVQINQLAGTTTGSAGNDVLMDVIEQIKGTNFNDVLSGGHGINVLDGEGGNDQFFGNNGDDLMRGGTGDDTFFFSTNDGNDTLLGGDGFDILDYSTLAGVVQVNQLAGTTTGTANNDILSDIFEMVIGTAFGDVLSGGHGINSLKGNGGDDQIFANNGDDYTSGGDGNDTITMGLGNDVHDFRNGEDIDTILDFTAGGSDDLIDLKFYSGLAIANFTQLQASGRLATVSGKAELTLDGGDKIIFNNVASHTLLTSADFVFV